MHSLLGLLTVFLLCSGSSANQNDIITHKLHKRSHVGVGRLKTFSSKRSPGISNMQLVADLLNSERDVSPVQQTSTGLLNQDGTDVSYFIDCLIGSDNQNFSVVVDTGSYYTWVYGSECSSEVCSRHRSFNKQNSTTSETLPYTFSIQYSSGTVSGSVINDEISFSGFETRIDFGLADSAGETFGSFPIDGIMGLSAKDSSATAFPGVINTLFQQKLISKRIFGVNLGRSSDKQDEGSITFGGLDSSKYTGDIHFTPVKDGSILWNIGLDGLTMGRHAVEFDSPRTAIVDTGTTLLVLPPSDALKLHSYIQGAQTDGTNFAIPCSTSITLQLTIGGYNWTISPRDYMAAKNGDSEMCVSNIQGVAFQGNSTWILGDVFLKNVYSVFDVDNQQVGFAQKLASQTNATADDTFVYSAISSQVFNSTGKSSLIGPSLTLAGNANYSTTTSQINTTRTSTSTACTSMTSTSIITTSSTSQTFKSPSNSGKGRKNEKWSRILMSALFIIALLDN